MGRDLSDPSKAVTTMAEQQTMLQAANDLLQRKLSDARADHDIMRAIHEAELAKLRELAGEAGAAGNRGLQATFLAEVSALRKEFAAWNQSTIASASVPEARGPSEDLLASGTPDANVEMGEDSGPPASEDGDELARTMAATKLLGDTKSQVSDKAESAAALNVF